MDTAGADSANSAVERGSLFSASGAAMIVGGLLAGSLCSGAAAAPVAGGATLVTIEPRIVRSLATMGIALERARPERPSGASIVRLPIRGGTLERPFGGGRGVLTHESFLGLRSNRRSVRLFGWTTKLGVQGSVSAVVGGRRTVLFTTRQLGPPVRDVQGLAPFSVRTSELRVTATGARILNARLALRAFRPRQRLGTATDRLGFFYVVGFAGPPAGLMVDRLEPSFPTAGGGFALPVAAGALSPLARGRLCLDGTLAVSADPGGPRVALNALVVTSGPAEGSISALIEGERVSFGRFQLPPLSEEATDPLGIRTTSADVLLTEAGATRLATVLGTAMSLDTSTPFMRLLIAPPARAPGAAGIRSLAGPTRRVLG